MLLLLLATSAGSLMAQTSNGTLVGTVEDPTGAALEGATVSAQSVDTGAIRTAETISNGSYRIESLLPGTYTVTVKAPNFQSTVVSNLHIAASVVTTSDVTLKVGNTSEQVEVVANGTAVNTDNAQISGTIGTLEISSLPVSSLNPYALALTLPGVIS
ncbi:MAG TPA: carboxypeptidase-like regulatory domain-containing protein, partial [Terracidiphilus sp.]|nr:carboxypeptidase-like regulatory domain-containing protein [Terracidiphilus sp.]